MSAGSAKRAVRVPVSLRLPARIVRAVEDYACDEGLNKTDAFLHLLQKGIDGSRAEDEGAVLRSIERQVSEALVLLRGGERASGHRAPQHDAAACAVARAAECFPAIKRAFLFGSFARGTFSETSDIDVRIELSPDEPFNLHDLEHFMKRIEQDTGREVDVVSAREVRNKALADAIEQDKELVYERKA